VRVVGRCGTEGRVVVDGGDYGAKVNADTPAKGADKTLPVVSVAGLTYSYRKPSESPGASKSLHNVSFDIQPGSRVLLVGCNGAGKSTLLSILGGRKMLQEGSATILGRHVFHDTTLNGVVMYLGEWWSRDVFLDITVEECLGKDCCKKDRTVKLVDILQVDLSWNIARVSDGQRRRCQLLAALVNPDSKVYLMDEVTSDLDLVSRSRLLSFLYDESTHHGLTVLYATHIFDNMEQWATHIMYLKNGHVELFSPLDEEEEYTSYLSARRSNPLYLTVQKWLTFEDLTRRMENRAQREIAARLVSNLPVPAPNPPPPKE